MARARLRGSQSRALSGEPEAGRAVGAHLAQATLDKLPGTPFSKESTAPRKNAGRPSEDLGGQGHQGQRGLKRRPPEALPTPQAAAEGCTPPHRMCPEAHTTFLHLFPLPSPGTLRDSCLAPRAGPPGWQAACHRATRQAARSLLSAHPRPSPDPQAGKKGRPAPSPHMASETQQPEASALSTAPVSRAGQGGPGWVGGGC